MSRNDAILPAGRMPRNLVCLLGLPIDVIDMPTAVAKVRHAAKTGQRCFISTPNLNFLMAAQSDDSFRESVLRSDLSLADGVSLLMLARMMGVPLPERVSGADLFLQLCASTDQPPLTVFFLGGPPGAAKLASEKVNSEASGVRCVGFDEAGFGDIESISGQPLIDRINASGADFVVVSLGAKKGQAWIMRNQMRLNAPLICHLGAVVNFTAGTVRRAPMWMQQWRMEWLWRALTEPGLSKRYWDDGRALLVTIAKQALYAAAQERRLRGRPHQPAAMLSDQVDQGIRRLSLAGHWGQDEVPRLRDILMASEVDQIDIEASQMAWLDLHAVGTLAGQHGQMRARGGRGIVIQGLAPALVRQIRRDGAGYLLAQEASLGC